MCSLTIQQLGDLFEISYALEARTRVQTIAEMATAAQGDSKSIKKLMDSWTRIWKKSSRQGGNDLQAFLARFGGGI